MFMFLPELTRLTFLLILFFLTQMFQRKQVSLVLHSGYLSLRKTMAFWAKRFGFGFKVYLGWPDQLFITQPDSYGYDPMVGEQRLPAEGHREINHTKLIVTIMIQVEFVFVKLFFYREHKKVNNIIFFIHQGIECMLKHNYQYIQITVN